MAIRSQRRFIGLRNVKPGMMVQFNYTKRQGGNGSYVVLVVDPDRKNEHATESQLHGFVIKDMTDSELVEFFSSFNKSINVGLGDKTASVVEDLNTDEAYQTFRSSKYVSDRSYRTFNRSAITQLRQILLGSVED
jgi:hypothetical protein